MKDRIEYTDKMYSIKNTQELIEWHGVRKVKECYIKYIAENYPIYHSVGDTAEVIFDLNNFQLAKEIYYDIIKRSNLDLPQIETILIEFIEQYD